MGGSPSTPSPDDSLEKKQLELMQEQTDIAKQEAGTTEQEAEAAANAPKPLPPPPPPTQDVGDLMQAQENARIQAARRTNTARGTLFAGNTGGYKPLGGAKTLLG
jgi:hypothetical protein